ncbi:hypothetical protein ACVXG7_00425 [Enterobacter hormaechei]
MAKTHAGGLRFLRSELAYVAAMHPDPQDDWSNRIKGTLSAGR